MKINEVRMGMLVRDIKSDTPSSRVINSQYPYERIGFVVGLNINAYNETILEVEWNCPMMPQGPKRTEIHPANVEIV